MKSRLFIAVATAGLAVSTAFLSACGKAHSSQPETAATNEPKRSPTEIKVEGALRQKITIGEPTLQNVAKTLEVAGRIEADETHLARVSSPVAGRVADVLAIEGDRVRHGQPLATINSTELAEQESAFLKARAQNDLAERAVSRAKLLLAAEVIGAAELQRRETELQEAQAELAASHRRLKVLGLPDRSIDTLSRTRVIDSLSHLYASAAGTVLERKVSVGQVLQPADPAFVIADLSNVWLVADIPEQSGGNLRRGQKVEAEISAFPGMKVAGTLALVGATVDRQTRTVSVRMNLANREMKFKPGMLATMSIGDGVRNERVVPIGAIVHEDNREFVFAEKAADLYDLTPVQLGPEAGGGRVLVKGLENGRRIVTDGAFHLNNERKRLLLGASN